MDILISLIMVVISALIIAKACDGFEAAADYLGRNLSEGVKGASINAIGSSMPELFATFVFLFLYSNTTGFAGGIGTTAGSAVFNTMIIPAVSILVALKMFKIGMVEVSKKVILRDGLMLIAIEFILIVTISETLEWWHGMMLMLLYFAYIGYMFASMKRSDSNDDDDDDDDDEKENSSNRLVSFFKLDLEYALIGNGTLQKGNSWGLLAVSTFFIAIACYILVEGCEQFGVSMGIEGYFVAVILAAAASSVPDTILSMKDARKGNYDDAVSNALGSNIFDICFALGLPLFLYTIIYGPITMSTETADNVSELRILLLLLTIGAFFIFLFGKGLGKLKAFTLLALYGLFAAYIIGKAYEMTWAQPYTEALHQIQNFIK
ncbi:MAG: hypothetical protein P1U35_12605 [Cycloclasticus sp.]|nr:hypothetical protein [Cycloclasticus sp.]